MRQALLALVAIGLAASLAGAGTMAFFNDTETSEGNTFTAGTLDLKLMGPLNSPKVVHVTFDEVKPGQYLSIKLRVKNTGNLPGILSFEFTDIINNDNGCNEPELAADDSTPGDVDGKGGGELGDKLRIHLLNLSPYGDVLKDTFCYKTKLNDLGGKTFDFSGAAGILDPDECNTFLLYFHLPEKVGNIVQSDSVEFDIIFHLDQA